MPGQTMMRHPSETMDDLTDLSADEAMERRNTIMVTKSMEVRSKTVFGLIVGLVVGVAASIPFVLLLGPIAAPVALLPTAIGPLLSSGTVRDRTEQARYSRLWNAWRGRGVEGRVWFPNGNQPEDLDAFRPEWFDTR